MKLSLGVVVFLIILVALIVFIFTVSYYKNKQKTQTKETIPPWEKYKKVMPKSNNDTDIVKELFDAGMNAKETGMMGTIKNVLHTTSKKVEELTRDPKIESQEKAEKRKNELKDIDNKENENSIGENITIPKETIKPQRIWKRQEECRRIFEKIFNEPFPESSPSWCVNKKGSKKLGIKAGGRLRIDGYNAKRKLGFEHQGKFHDVYPNSFHKTEEEFEYQQIKDREKFDRCEENKITLIYIPDEDVVAFRNLYTYITTELEKRGYIDFED